MHSVSRGGLEVSWEDMAEVLVQLLEMGSTEENHSVKLVHLKSENLGTNVARKQGELLMVHGMSFVDANSRIDSTWWHGRILRKMQTRQRLSTPYRLSNANFQNSLSLGVSLG